MRGKPLRVYPMQGARLSFAKPFILTLFAE
jgi:hypothetical protein